MTAAPEVLAVHHGGEDSLHTEKTKSARSKSLPKASGNETDRFHEYPERPT